MSYLYGAAGALILFFIVQILQKKQKNRADYLLVCINLVIGLFFIADILVQRELTSFSIILQNTIPLFLFPFFVHYVVQFVQAEQGVSPRWNLVFLPGIAFVIYSVVDHTLLTDYSSAEALEKHFNDPNLVYQFFFKGSQLLFIFILTWLLLQLRKFEQKLKDGYSFIETVSLKWLRNFTLIYLFSVFATFVLFLMQNLGILKAEINEVFGIVYGVLVLSVFYLNFEGIRHYTLSQVYGGEERISKTSEAQNGEIEKPGDSLPQKGSSEVRGGKPEVSKADHSVHQKLVTLFKEEQVYLTSKYGLRDLAADLEESTHTVSRVINTIEQRTFYDLVNSYRVEHLKTLLTDPANQSYTILALGLDSGFNSKASINRIFKNFTGLTPRQYLEQQAQPIG